MKIVDRVSRLVKSDAHGILEQLEERSLLLKQSLRDAEIALEAKRVHAEALEAEQRRLREDAERLRASERRLDEDVELALAGGKTDLARFAVGKLLPVRESRRDGEARIAQLGSERDRVAEQLLEQEAQLEELRARVQARLASEARERQTPPVPRRPAADEEIELELLRRGEARTERGVGREGEGV